ncbi:unnamed protein product, partial [Brachionus calyciflorus]
NPDWWKEVNKNSKEQKDSHLDREICEKLNEGFYNIWNKEKQPDLTRFIVKQVSDKKLSIFSQNLVLKTLENLKPSSTGPDEISAAVLKSARLEIVDIVTKLFNFYINNSFVPEQWKKADITPIPKVTSDHLQSSRYEEDENLDDDFQLDTSKLKTNKELYKLANIEQSMLSDTSIKTDSKLSPKQDKQTGIIAEVTRLIKSFSLYEEPKTTVTPTAPPEMKTYPLSILKNNNYLQNKNQITNTTPIRSNSYINYAGTSQNNQNDKGDPKVEDSTMDLVKFVADLEGNNNKTKRLDPNTKKFSGSNSEDVDDWLFNVEQRFIASKIREEDKLNSVLNFVDKVPKMTKREITCRNKKTLSETIHLATQLEQAQNGIANINFINHDKNGKKGQFKYKIGSKKITNDHRKNFSGNFKSTDKKISENRSQTKQQTWNKDKQKSKLNNNVIRAEILIYCSTTFFTFGSNVKFFWSKECEIAFSDLKNALTSYPILRIFNPKKTLKAYTDASGLAIGGILTQVDDDGKEYILC